MIFKDILINIYLYIILIILASEYLFKLWHLDP